jgi:membrane protease YdiL (CAAX protease family)
VSGIRRTVALGGLFLAVIVPVVGPTRHLPAVPGVNPLYVHEGFWWALLAVVVLYVLIVERRSLASIGLHRPSWKTVVFGILAGIVGVGGIILIEAAVLPLLHLRLNVRELGTLLHTPLWYRILLVTRAAMMEETLFRGYGIERLTELSGSRWLAGAVTWGLFTLAHVSGWGWAQLIVAGYGGLILTALYLWRRDLVCNMIGHWLTDGAGFLLSQ